MLPIALVLLSSMTGDEAMELLLRRLRSDEPQTRADASSDLLGGWLRWESADLAALETATHDADPEVAGRASEAFARIRIRRTLGSTLVRGVRGADDAFYKGTDYERLKVLRDAKSLWRAGKLRREDLAGLEGLATRAEWDDPTNLDAFMKETDAPEAFSIAGDAESRTRLRVKEVELLGTGGPDRAAKVAEYLSDGAPEVRATALRVIAASRAREQAPKVATLLRDKRSEVRADALALLRSWGAKEYAPGFQRLLEDPNQAIRRRAMEALGSWGQKSAGPQIALFLRDPFAPSRADAALTLGLLGSREFTTDLIPLLRDTHASVRQSAAFALGRFGAAECAPQIRTLLRDRDPEVRWTAARSLGQFGSEGMTDPVVDLLRDPDSEVATQAAWVLGLTASREAVERIAPLLDSSDAELRQRAACALGLLRSRDHSVGVARLLKDPSAWVRSEAAFALARIGGKDHAGDVAVLLRDPDRKVRVDAVLTLGELGAGDPGGVLAGLEGDPDRLLALASTLSLVRLGKRGPAALRAALREIASDDLAFACLGTVAAEVASFALSQDAWAVLERPLQPAQSIDSWTSLSAALSAARLTFEVQTECAIGRLDKSMVMSGRDALTWLLGRTFAPTIVLDGRTVRLMERRDALEFWRSRMNAK